MAEDERQYVITTGELYQAATANLGSISDKTYDEFEKELKETVEKWGIQNPVMAVGLVFNKPSLVGVRELAWQLGRQDWNELVEKWPDLVSNEPNIFVIDGSKYRFI